MFMELILFAFQVAKRFLCSVAACFFQRQAESFYNSACSAGADSERSPFRLPPLPIGPGQIASGPYRGLTPA
jgi:hypothetical protein